VNHQPADPGYQRGDRIALEHTSDPHTCLVPGTAGTVTGYDPDLGQLDMAWDDGSSLSMLLRDGDQVRLITRARAPAAGTRAAREDPASAATQRRPAAGSTAPASLPPDHPGQ
jgi:Domain of unknown function (DUF4314)